MNWRILEGDALTVLRTLEDGSVQTCVTSPPYFGLRDYGTGSWDGGDEGCDHVRPKTTYNDGFNARYGNAEGQKKQEAKNEAQYSAVCARCGARRVDDQVGLEPTPDEYVARLVEVFREVRRVLRDDGTLWLNLGDSYSAQGGSKEANTYEGKRVSEADWQPKRSPFPGTKPKDLLGIPWMVAFALRADGWYLRSDVIWAKPNPMPESVTDRPTKAHEYLFLLSKSPRYFYDADAVREADEAPRMIGRLTARERDGATSEDRRRVFPDEAGRNKRSVWTVATQPFPGAHFAVFPPKLIEPCVLAGSAETACGVCGAPWERVVERTVTQPGVTGGVTYAGSTSEVTDVPGERQRLKMRGGGFGGGSVETTGWYPTCDHTGYVVSGTAERENNLAAETRARAEGARAIPDPSEPGAWRVVPRTGTSTVLDPFSGAGTTGLVATRLGRSYIGIELNPTYAEMSRERIRDDQPLMNYLSEAA